MRQDRQPCYWLATLVARFLLCLGGTLSVAPAAELEVALTEQDYYAELPIVLSPTRLAQPLAEAPAAVSVIDREMIDASGARTIPELLRLVPGFLVGFVDPYTPAVTYHGLADQLSRRMQVLIDGRSVYIPSIGGVPWTDLPLAIDDIERIEVVRGPNAATYGANSFLGVISITTRHASQDYGTYARVRYGSQKERQAVLRHGGTAGDLDYRLSLGYTEDTGFPDLVDSKHVSLLTARADYRASLRDTLQFQFGFSGGPRDVENSSDVQSSYQKQIRSHFEQARWERTIGTDEALSVQFFHTFHATDDDFVLALGSGVPVSLDLTAQRFDLEVQHNFRPAEALRVVWGGSARQDRVRSVSYFGTPDTLTNNLYRLFGNAEWQLSRRAVLNAGAMLEHEGFTGASLSPRLALNYRVAPSHTLRGSISKAMRTPVMFEEALDTKLGPPAIPVTIAFFRSSGGLRPETIVSRELGYIAELSSIPLLLDVKLYRDEVRQLITFFDVSPNPNAPFADPPKDWANLDHATVSGIETQINYRPSANTRLILNYAYTDIDATHTRREVDYARSAPWHSTSLLAIQRLAPRLQGSLAYYYVGPMRWLDAGEPLDPIRRLDARLGYQFRGGRTRGEIALVGYNLLGEYQDFAIRPANKVETGAALELTLQFD